MISVGSAPRRLARSLVLLSLALAPTHAAALIGEGSPMRFADTVLSPRLPAAAQAKAIDLSFPHNSDLKAKALVAGWMREKGRALRPTLIASTATATRAADACRPDRVSLQGPWGRARFDVELADTDELRSLGLMNRPEMARRAGMLFVYPRPQRAVFWMRNTLIPLDMIFADAAGRVTNVHSNAIPLDETPIDGGRDIRFVLEINGGLAARYGIAPGTMLRHPSIGPAAAWPCS